MLRLSMILLASSSLIFCNQADYCWREYTGTIPEDAVIGGKDINGRNVYIGQAYVKNEGLMVVQINPGVKQVVAPIKGSRKLDKHIKILCGPEENFGWLDATASNLHLKMIDKHAVIGGHEDGLGKINIGRISYEGGSTIGKINSFNVGTAYFRFIDSNDKEGLVHSYQVLIYDKKSDQEPEIH